MHKRSCNASRPMRRAVFFLLTASAAMNLGGCDPHQPVLMSVPEPHQLRLAVADRSYRLPDADREKLLPGFDVEAIERLMMMTRPDMRQEILKAFQRREPGRHIGHLMGFDDPELQRVLEEVWAPMWDHVGATDAQIEENAYGFPGREIAKQWRAARAVAQRRGTE